MTAVMTLQASLGRVLLQSRSSLQARMSRLRPSLVGSWGACGGDRECQNTLKWLLCPPYAMRSSTGGVTCFKVEQLSPGQLGPLGSSFVFHS